MGELLIKIGDNGPDPDIRDGDPIVGFTTAQILRATAGVLCHVRRCNCNGDGLRPTNSLADYYQQHTYRYKYERVSTDTLQRTEISSGEVSMISSQPNAAGEHCHVSEYITRRLKHKQHRIFGSSGSEIFYGGTRLSMTADTELLSVIKLWDAIEDASDHRRDDNKRYPFRSELRTDLAICCDDMTHPECCEALREDYGDGQPGEDECICCRANTVDWRDLALASESKIIDGKVSIDVRDQPQVYSEIIRLKDSSH